MKTIKILLFALLLILTAVPAFAQTATTQTVLSAAMTTSSTTTALVASATGITASTNTSQTFLFIDRELMQIRTVSGTTITVIRGVGSTFATPHNINAIVTYGVGGGRYNPVNGDTQGVFQTVTPVGPCNTASQQFSPVVNTRNGDISACLNIYGIAPANSPAAVGSTGRWHTTNLYQYVNGLAITPVNNVAYTALLSDTFVNYVNLTAARTVTLPSITGIEGKIIVIKNSSSDTSTITIAGVNGQGVGTGPGTGTVAQSGQGSVTRLISIIAGAATGGATLGTNAYTWATW